MNKEHPFRERAEKNRQRIEKPERKPDETLPPRSRVERQQGKKPKIKVKYPVIRLLVLFFILVPVTVFGAISYMDDTNGKQASPGVYDEVSFEMGKKATSTEPVKETAADEAESGEDEADGGPADESEPATSENGESPPGKENEAVTDGNETAATPGASEPNEDTGIVNPPQNDTAKENVVYHKVKPDETLYRIAMTYFNDKKGIETIRKENGIIGNEIMTGQILKITLAEEHP